SAKRARHTRAQVIKEEIEGRSLRLGCFGLFTHPTAGDGMGSEKAESKHGQSDHFTPEERGECKCSSYQHQDQSEPQYVATSPAVCSFTHPGSTYRPGQVNHKDPSYY